MLLDFLSDLERSSGSLAAAQASQSAALVGAERFIATVVGTQTVQSDAGTARERFVGTMAASQLAQASAMVADADFRGAIAAVQSGQMASLAGAERFIASLTAAQAIQTDAITAQTPANSSAVIATIQLAQTGDIEAAGPVVVDPPATPAQGWLHMARVSGPSVAREQPVHTIAIAASQAPQSAHLEAEHDDSLDFAYLELAA